jgi:Flp pilus assembly protein TadB
MIIKIKAFLQLIEKYWIMGATLVAAIFAYMFYRRGEKIQELQHEIVKNRLKNEKDNLQKKVEKSEKIYEKALEKYKHKRNTYRTLIRKYRPIKGRKPAAKRKINRMRKSSK